MSLIKITKTSAVLCSYCDWIWPEADAKRSKDNDYREREGYLLSHGICRKCEIKYKSLFN